jgi:hypothetical protein
MDWLCESYNHIIMSDKYVPLISSGVAGQLGVVHPRACAESLSRGDG